VETGCGAIVAHVAGLKELVDAFHGYAKMPAVSPRPTDVCRLLEEVVALYTDIRPGVHVRAVSTGNRCRVLLDSALIRQALVNLIDNSVEACGEAGSITVSGVLADHELTLVVEDDGPGLPTDQAELLVQPFFSTKGRGTGMGLALVHRIVTDHGGALELMRSEAGGTRVCIRLSAVTVRGAETEAEA
jgi:nitrogen fixation/metabolism regulation signal transduction histidine kinase